jgi:hypothetical protein
LESALRISLLVPLTGLLATFLLGPGCRPKPSEATAQAQTVAQAADDRVAALEKEIADLKAAKAPAPGAAEHVTKSHLKALDRRLADAKATAGEARKAAAEIAATPAAQAPKLEMLEVPTGTQIKVTVARELATGKDQAGDPWEGKLAEAVSVNGAVAWAAGTPVKGVVAQSAAAGRLSGGAGGLGIRLSTVGKNDVEAGTYLVVGDSRGQRNTKFIGGGAALGALVGALTGGRNAADHALGGAALGAAAGTGLAAGTADTTIRIPAGAPVTFTLSAPEKVLLRK